MATCSRSVFPPKVIQQVQQETADFELDSSTPPESMQLPTSLKRAHLGDATIVEIEINSNKSSEEEIVKEVDVVRAREVLLNFGNDANTKYYAGSICLVETGVDDEGLQEFYSKYFKYPLYCDKSYAFYQALGDRKVSIGILMNPISLISMACSAYERITSKNIGGNVGKGEGLVQGGIIIFDSKGKPKYAYQEETGHDLPVKDILAAVNAVRKEAMGESANGGDEDVDVDGDEGKKGAAK